MQTVYIIFNNYCDSGPKRLNFKIGDNYLQMVGKHKYLGLTFDFHMTLETHIESVV